MNLFDDLNEDNYIMFATKYYDNPQCTTVEEFNDDLNKIKYVKRLFNRFLETGELRTNLILNHLIMIYNLFDNESGTRILFYKIEDNSWAVLKPFLIYLRRMPKIVRGVRGTDIRDGDIQLDQHVVKKLRCL